MSRLHRPLGWGLLLFLAWLLAGCSAVQTQALRDRRAAASPHEFRVGLPDAAELIQTPFFPQTEFHCGPAALATVLVAHGLSVTPEELGGAVYLPARQGSLQTEMLAAARRFGMVPTRVPGHLEALLKELAEGQPVVVFLNLGLGFAPAWHYAVLVGYDLPAGKVVLRSGTRQRELMSMSTFEHTWVRAGSWAFVVREPGRWPVTAEEKAVLEASMGFERVAPPEQALAVYRSAVARWPANLSLQMGLANTLYASGRQREAASTYKAAALLHESVPAWINLADTLLELGDPAGAAKALEQAEAIHAPQWKPQLEAIRSRLRSRQAR
jgi:hypothetical protein